MQTFNQSLFHTALLCLWEGNVDRYDTILRISVDSPLRSESKVFVTVEDSFQRNEWISVGTSPARAAPVQRAAERRLFFGISELFEVSTRGPPLELAANQLEWHHEMDRRTHAAGGVWKSRLTLHVPSPHNNIAEEEVVQDCIAGVTKNGNTL